MVNMLRIRKIALSGISKRHVLIRQIGILKKLIILFGGFIFVTVTFSSHANASTDFNCGGGGTYTVINGSVTVNTNCT